MPKNALDMELLKDQVIRLATSLGLHMVDRRPSAEDQSCEERVADAVDIRTPLDADMLTVALAWNASRVARDKIFGADLFTDPAWDMLLDLYIHHCRCRPVSVSSLSMASRGSATTALRWLGLLEGRGLIARRPDPNDRRRVFLTFTPGGLRTMEQALATAAETSHKLGLGRLHLIQ